MSRQMWFVVTALSGHDLMAYYDEADAMANTLHWSMPVEVVEKTAYTGNNYSWEQCVFRGKLYLKNNPSGAGNLHIVLEDANIEDHHLWWSKGYCDALKDYSGSDVMEVMLDMSPEERSDYLEAIS